MSNMKKVFGMAKKKSEDFDEDACSYSDPTLLHATEPPSRNSRGFPQPHYPPPRPQHSPNPRRKNEESTAQNTKKTQGNEATKNTEPRRAPPQRPNIVKKDSNSTEDDYCDPVDAQRKEQFQPDMKNKGIRDDYCEPWDTTKKSDFTNVPKKSSQSDDEYNEYMDPYDTGREGIIEKRRSRGLSKDFHGKLLPPQNTDQRRSSGDVPAVVVHDPRKVAATTDDYDMPWEWKKQIQMGKMVAPKPTQQNPRLSKAPSTAKDDYDEPWEKRQGYMMKNNPVVNNKTKSPIPAPRVNVNPGDQEVYEQPWEPQAANNAMDSGGGGVYEMPWEPQNEVNGQASSPTRRASQPAMTTAPKPPQNRKASQSGVTESDYYDTPWEYKTGKMLNQPPPKPIRCPEEHDMVTEINPDLPLDQQSWYHGPLKRLEAEDLLRDAPDCSFLVRNSESSKKDFSLSMKNNDNFLHLKIVRQLDGQFILGQFSKPFIDIPKVINHYAKNKLNIRGAEHKHLKHAVSCQPEYHIIEPNDDSHL